MFAPANAVEVNDFHEAIFVEHDVSAGVVLMQRSYLVHAGGVPPDGTENLVAVRKLGVSYQFVERMCSDGLEADVVRVAQKTADAHFAVSDGVGGVHFVVYESFGVLVAPAGFALDEEPVDQGFQRSGFGELLDDKAVLLVDDVAAGVENFLKWRMEKGKLKIIIIGHYLFLAEEVEEARPGAVVV